MGKRIKYATAVSEEILGDFAPVPFQGSLADGIKKASAFGCDNVEIQIRNPAAIDQALLMDSLKEHMMSVSAIGTGLEYTLGGLSFTSPDEEVREVLRNRFYDHIGLAAKLDAVVFIGMCRGKAPSYKDMDDYLDILEKQLIPVVDHAKDKGVILAFEPIAFYLTNMLNKTDETLEFLGRKSMQSVWLLLDTHHMYIEDENVKGAFEACRGRIAHVHLSDSNRRYPGCGNIDYIPVIEFLKQSLYDRTVSIEALPWPSAEEAVILGLEYIKRISGD